MIAANSDSIIHAVMNLGVLTGASRGPHGYPTIIFQCIDGAY